MSCICGVCYCVVLYYHSGVRVDGVGYIVYGCTDVVGVDDGAGICVVRVDSVGGYVVSIGIHIGVVVAGVVVTCGIVGVGVCSVVFIVCGVAVAIGVDVYVAVFVCSGVCRCGVVVAGVVGVFVDRCWYSFWCSCLCR